jgi:hypothetical protein
MLIHYILIHYMLIHYLIVHYMIIHYMLMHYLLIHYTLAHYTLIHYILIPYMLIHYTLGCPNVTWVGPNVLSTARTDHRKRFASLHGDNSTTWMDGFTDAEAARRCMEWGEQAPTSANHHAHIGLD